MPKYCWYCGEKDCTVTHDESAKSNPCSYCQRCGKHDATYCCQDCLELVCWDCGLKGSDSYEPDTGFYVCGRCV